MKVEVKIVVAHELSKYYNVFISRHTLI
jgi:hypothetical protein